MTEQREYPIPTEQLATAFNLLTKLVWFFVAVALSLVIGDAIWRGLALPAVSVPFYPSMYTPGGIGLSYLYIMWRLQGGSVKVRHDSIVVTWPGGSEE